MNTDLLKASINSVVLLNEAEWRQLIDYVEFKMLKKNSFFLREGQVCDSVAMIQKGALIYYQLKETGKETTTDFAFAGDWVTDNRSRLNNSPSFINIKAIEDTDLIVISNENLDTCYRHLPKLEKLGRILIEQAFVKIAQRSIDLQTLSASQRYEKLVHEYPEIFQKIPLYHIANYLGIAPKSLSRIRKRG
jgi:CRP/FNR family transcriptional regulator, anaerobic regulatory protein